MDSPTQSPVRHRGAIAELIDELRTDRNGRLPTRQARRRWIVGVTLVVGAVLLGFSLSATPGDSRFYPLTVALGVVWVVGGFLAGPIPAGAFPAIGRHSPEGAPTHPRRNAVLLGVSVGLLVGACFVVGAFGTRLIPPLNDLIGRVLAYADSGSLVAIAAITLGNGVAEELFFRGAVYTAARPWHPLVVSTAIYVVVTMASGNVMLGFAGVILGGVCAVLRRATGGVLAPLCTHVVWSVIVLFALPPIVGV
ncbi:CPBP family intramembrane glutamic endopeptidase [Gordonia polyisoprenivorans]|uniref:CPBP family intramembrane glutamic endopeptidase n=1 Tax=Gordonia polyisoprenivorans TaxID=84595 RepID=UPI0022FFDF88|nr:type II CAAX endopeptidase family protein [Gordonia polyisoprenivorans]WCB35546.1 type II CAAX endopeptidase family protein [Gordonia polyisoprenivorans]